MGAVRTPFAVLARRIRAEFEEVPGLQLTVDEGVRFWALDSQTCAQVLQRLHEAGFLARTADGRYQRAPAV